MRGGVGDRNDGRAGEASQVTPRQRENQVSGNNCATNIASTNRCGLRPNSPRTRGGSAHDRGGKLCEKDANKHEFAAFFEAIWRPFSLAQLVAF